jgi:hypothetical protein
MEDWITQKVGEQDWINGEGLRSQSLAVSSSVEMGHGRGLRAQMSRAPEFEKGISIFRSDSRVKCLGASRRVRAGINSRQNSGRSIRDYLQ